MKLGIKPLIIATTGLFLFSGCYNNLNQIKISENNLKPSVIQTEIEKYNNNKNPDKIKKYELGQKNKLEKILNCDIIGKFSNQNIASISQMINNIYEKFPETKNVPLIFKKESFPKEFDLETNILYLPVYNLEKLNLYKENADRVDILSTYLTFLLIEALNDTKDEIHKDRYGISDERKETNIEKPLLNVILINSKYDTFNKNFQENLIKQFSEIYNN